MMPLWRAGFFVILLLLAGAPRSHAQAAARALPVWEAPPLPPTTPGNQRWARDAAPRSAELMSRSRSHTGTGLLVGAIIGAAATTVFLIGFCDDPDTKCELDEVGRAAVLIAVPAAAVGALIGSLIRTEE